MRLSHSSVSCFQECAKKYHYRYVEKLFPKTTHAALLFGSALDKAVEILLQTSSYDKAKIKFIEMWNRQEINKVPESLQENTKIVYANSDFDWDLLSKEDADFLSTYTKDDIVAAYNSASTQKDAIGYDLLKKELKVFFNVANWLCLKNKGLLMLESFDKYIMPNIEKVFATQVPIELMNTDGDNIIGYADFVVKWKNEENPIIFDLKTSSREYDKDSVLSSPQLTLYTHTLGETYKTRKAGFIVLNKHIRKNKTKVCSVCGFDGSGQRHKTCSNEVEGKRCGGEWIETIKPEVYIQVLINDISDRLEEIMLENYNMINDSIKSGIFPRSFTSCKQGYGLCPYYDVCYKNNCDKMIKMEDK